MLLEKYSPMNLILLIVWTVTLLGSVRGVEIDDGNCATTLTIGDSRRTTTEDPGTCGALCDNYIDESKWYRLDYSNSGVRIPESCVSIWHCGTYIPIWLSAPHPSESWPGPYTLPVCAQLSDKGPCCEWSSQIRVKWCPSTGGSDYFIYKLKRPPYCDMAYCAGSAPNCGNTGSWNDVIKNCTSPAYPSNRADVTLRNPTINETKAVTDDQGKPFTASKFTMTCLLYNTYSQLSIDNGARYDVIFEAGGQLVYKQTLKSTDPPMVIMGESYLVGQFGKIVTCKVSSYWESPYPARSPYKVSNGFFFGIRMLSSTRAVLANLSIDDGETATVTFEVATTFPITTPGCFNLAPGATCYPYYTFLFSSSGIYISSCSFRISNETQASGKVVISGIPFSESPNSASFNWRGELYFQTENSIQAQNSIFSGYTSQKYPVSITNPKPTVSCNSMGDPHVSTFQRKNFNVYLDGVFTLLKLDSKQIYVQARHFKCNGNYYCNCGVIAREGNNILGVDDCGPYTIAKRYRYDAQNPGGYITYDSDRRWTIHLPSGLVISAATYSYVNWLDIVVSAKSANYQGMCSYPEQQNEDCLDYCNNNYKVSSADSFFDHDPPPCFSNPPIAPQCDCSNGVSRNSRCTTLDQRNLVDGNKPCPSSVTSRRKRTADSNSPPATGNNSTYPYRKGSSLTEEEKYDACTAPLRYSVVYDLCTKVLSLNTSTIIYFCVLDIGLLDDADTPPSIVALQMEFLCKQYIDNNNISNRDDWKKAYNDRICPRQCNQRGNCSSAKCQCNKGYMSLDCSVAEGQVPQIQDIVTPACDITEGIGPIEERCRVVSLHATNISSDGSSCLLKDDKKEIISIDYSPDVSGEGLVNCHVPLLPVISHIEFNESVTTYIVYISISNDKKNYSNEIPFVVFNGSCVDCSKAFDCKNKITACNILGRCYENGTTISCGKATTDTRICNPAVSTSKWMPIGATNPDQGTEKCSSPKLTAITTVLFLSYLAIKLFFQ